MHSHKPHASMLKTGKLVLILVVMEDALAQTKNHEKDVICSVLILVVMEDALAH